MELMPGMTSHEADPILPPTPNSDTMNTPPKPTLEQAQGGKTIGCQTAWSYHQQDTLVPLTQLLQLVNNSILTVMENIEKVLVVNSNEEGILTADNLASVWNVANSSITSSPNSSGLRDHVSSSPTLSLNLETKPAPVIEERTSGPKQVRPIVIQDRFDNSLEIPHNSVAMDTGDMETGPPPEKKQCTEQRRSPHNNTSYKEANGLSSPVTTPTYLGPCESRDSLSPTVNVAGSLTKYICPYCYKVFNWKTNMNRHISVTHLMKPKPTIKVPIMRKSKPYTCPICGNTFAWRSNMNRHILHLHKIDHKQLNKLVLSACLPDMRSTENTVQGVNSEGESFSSLGSLTMLPQNSFKTVTPPPPTPVSSSAFNPATTSPEQLSLLYRNHNYKALLESVMKKEQVPLHVKEAALTSFYQNNKTLFDGTGSTTSTSPVMASSNMLSAAGLLTPPKSDSIKYSSPPTTNINNLSALYQKALQDQRSSALEQAQRLEQQVQAQRSAAITTSASAPDVYQNHRAMLDTVSLLSNLNTMNVSNGTELKIKVDGTDN